MPYCTLPDQTKIFYEIYGEALDITGSEVKLKPTIVALHGGPAADHTFHIPFYKHFCDSAQIIMLDHRGCGRSDHSDPSHWNLKQWAQDLDDFCKTLNIVKPYISGISFGGWVAMQHSIMYPDNAKALILSDTEATFNRNELLSAFESVGGKKARAITDKFYAEPNEKHAEQFTEYCLPHFTRNRFPVEYFQTCLVQPETVAYFNQHELFSFNLFNDLPKITCPVLYFTGTINPVHRQQNAINTKNAMTNAKVQLETFDDLGFLTTDAPEQLAKHIKQFIQK